jgi:predicted transcriptional regulator
LSSKLDLAPDLQDAIARIAVSTNHSETSVLDRALRLYLLGEGGEILRVYAGIEQLREGEFEDMDDVITQLEHIIRSS